MLHLNYNTTSFTIPKYGHLISNIQQYNFHDLQPVKLNPIGCIELIVQDGRFSQSNGRTNEWQERPTAFIGGLHHQSFSILPMNADSSLISISFKANAAKFFIPDDLSLLKNQIIPADEIYKTDQLNQLSEVRNTNMDLKLKNIEAFLDVAFMHRAPSSIDAAIAIIKDAKGCLSIMEVAAQVGLGPSQFRRRFLTEVGISPKVYARIIRINAIEQLLKAGSRLKLTELSYQFDYFDQAHFTKDFKAVVGISPKKYLQSIGV
ncbi:MAG: AraC-like DNA-binding protein [Crocinitomix sp.]|jgi:AraC-like DNA-binding protein